VPGPRATLIYIYKEDCNTSRVGGIEI